MFTKIKELLFGKPSEPEAPYKIESPVPTIPADTPAPTAVVIEEVKPVVATPAKPRAEKKPAAPKKQQFEKKPVAPRSPAKPRAPAKPKPAK